MLYLPPFHLGEDSHHCYRNVGKHKYGEGEKIKNLFKRTRLYIAPFGNRSNHSEQKDEEITAAEKSARQHKRARNVTVYQSKDNGKKINNNRRYAQEKCRRYTHCKVVARAEFF